MSTSLPRAGRLSRRLSPVSLAVVAVVIGSLTASAGTIPVIPTIPVPTSAIITTSVGPVAVVTSSTLTATPSSSIATSVPTASPTIAAATTLGATTLAATTVPVSKTATTTTATTKAGPTTKTAPTTKPGPTTKAGPTTKPGPKASKRNAAGQWSPNGRPFNSAIAFDPTPPSSDKSLPSAPSESAAFSAVQPDGKPLFLLIVGSDARSGEKVDRSRSDAVHLFAYNPTKKKGVLVGFPRDTWVTPPGASARKLSGVLSTSGPDTLVKTVANVTGLPVNRYAITGFDGFTKMINGIGGVNVKVAPSMNDKASGAQFQEGWFNMNGDAALAYSRARKTLPKGDLSRSANQEKFLIATLAKLRESTGNVSALTTWVNLGRKNMVSNIKAGDWLYYAQVARGIDPNSINTMVVPATPKTISGQSAVVLNQPAFATLMKDLADGTLG
jgi:polyisoprenyl-teichoic acid--peptidoglycan teichoic acid transferase